MAWKSLGLITVTNAGTPQRLTTTHTNVHGIFIQANPANTGKMFVGTSALVASTLTGVLGLLPPPTTTSYPSLDSSIIGGPNALDLADIYIDAAVSNESVLVSYLEN